MQVNRLFDAINKTLDDNGYRGALSMKEVKAHDPDTGDVFEVTGISWDAANSCFLITVILEEEPDDE